MADPGQSKRGAGSRYTLLLITLVALAPIVASTVVYLYFPRSAQTNYGQLLKVAPAPEIIGTRSNGTPFRLSALQGKWLLVVATPGACGEGCRRALYATRQARTIQGREQDRVVRVWLVTDEGQPPPEVLQEHPGLVVARIASGALGGFPAGDRAIYLVDPHGNLVLLYPENPDIKGLAKDLGRLLRASSIG